MSNLADSMPFSTLMGVDVTEATKTKVTGRLTVRADLCTAGGTLHGGAIMAFADALGAIGGFLNLEEGQRTTTLESKTNFLSAAPEGTVVIGETTPAHIGKSTSVWHTRITRESDGKQIALVTQTQMVVS
jgi:1,4-dihydroxy-2-naphthoyl-CoA hydrolase